MTRSPMPSDAESAAAIGRVRSRVVLVITAALFSTVAVFVMIATSTGAASANTSHDTEVARHITTPGADDAMSVVIAGFGLAVFGLVWFMTRRRAARES